MYAQERQRYIEQMIQQLGTVSAVSLSESLGVAGETIRRDLILLERRGVLQRTHGGAIGIERLGFDPSPATRETTMRAEKDAIVRAALDQLPNEGAVLIDSGSTMEALVRVLSRDSRLTIVTHGFRPALALSQFPHVNLLLLGGRWRSGGDCTVDSWALSNLNTIVADVAFIGVNGLSTQRGLTTTDQSEAAVKSAMIGAAHWVVVLADHSKIGVDYFCRIAELDTVDLVITDSGVNLDLVEDLRLAGPQVAIA